MNYILKHFDTSLIEFSATEDSSYPEIKILWINDEKRKLMPKDLDLSEEGLESWLRHRTIPKNRAFVNAFLARCGLHLNRPMNIISVCKGLSLNDCYWVVDSSFEGSFKNYNLYENRFSNIIAQIAFTGYGSSLRSSLTSSPEFTTNGMLPKCWRRIRGKIFLYKGGTSGASNAGNEPYSEFYASQVAKAMGIEAITYGLSKWKGNLCSTCEIFTSKKYSYMPIGRIVKKGGFKAVYEYYVKLGPQFEQALRDMLVFDAIICNTDRHFGNFGVLIHNETNEIVAPAPLFDHGNSLFNFAGPQYMKTEELLQEYVDTLMPCVYDDFIETAKKYMNADNRKQVRSLLKFKLKKNSRYNLSDKEIEMINHQIQKRAALLLQ